MTDERFPALMQVLARKVSGKYRRYIFSVIEEMNELDAAEEMQEDYEIILAAIDEGYQTERDIQKFTKLHLETIRFELEMMPGGGTLEVLPQGGKTAEARGQVKKIYERVENQNYNVPEGYADAYRFAACQLKQLCGNAQLDWRLTISTTFDTTSIFVEPMTEISFDYVLPVGGEPLDRTTSVMPACTVSHVGLTLPKTIS